MFRKPRDITCAKRQTSHPRNTREGGFDEKKTPNIDQTGQSQENQLQRDGVTQDWRRWLGAASTDDSPRASDWVTVIPTSPETTMTNVDFALCFKARFRLSQVTLGYPRAYIENYNRQVCGKPLDNGAWHVHDCARIPINERHNGLGLEEKSP